MMKHLRLAATTVALALIAPLTAAPAAADDETRTAATATATAARAWTQFLPFGDSVTLGAYRRPGSSQVYVENGYRGDLRARVQRRGLEPNFVGSCGAPGSCLPENPWPVDRQMGDWNHEGHAGWTTLRLDGIAAAAVLRERPRFVLLLTGANDLAANRTPHDYIVHLAKLVDDVHAADPSVHVFVATPTFKGNEPDWWSYVQGAAAVGGSRSYASVVPLHVVGQKPGELSDGVHPTPCGYARVAYVWYYYLGRSPLLNPAGTPWPTEYYPFASPATGPCAGVA